MGIPAFLKPYVKWEYLGREELAGFDRYKVGPAGFTCRLLCLINLVKTVFTTSTFYIAFAV